MAEIVDIKGVGPVMGDALRSCGFDSVTQVAGATPSDLAVVPGLGEQRAKSVIDAAKLLLTETPSADGNAEAESAAQGQDAPSKEASSATRSVGKKGKKAKKKKLRGKKKNKKKEHGKKSKKKNKNKKKKKK